MIRMILASAIVLFSGTAAYALNPTSGEYVCNRISSSSLRIDCYEAISRRGIDGYAAALCDRITSSSATVDCVRSAAGRSFVRSAVIACDRITSSSMTVDCLRAISDKYYTESEVRICDGVSSSSGTVDCFRRLGSYNGGSVIPSYPTNPSYPSNPRPGQNPPSVRGELCYVAQTGEWVDGDEFFSLVNRWVQRNNRCAVAKIATVPYSGRVYDRDGRRVAKEQGGLSNSQVDNVLRSYNLYGCERFTCTETR